MSGVQQEKELVLDPAFFVAIANTLLLVGGVLLITVIVGVLLALLLDQPMWGQGVLRILVIAPFFHTSAETVGITKNGAITRMRTMPCPHIG